MPGEAPCICKPMSTVVISPARVVTRIARFQKLFQLEHRSALQGRMIVWRFSRNRYANFDLLHPRLNLHHARHFAPNFRNWRGELGKALLARVPAGKDDGGGVCALGWNGHKLGSNPIGVVRMPISRGATNAIPHAPSCLGCIPALG